MEDVPGSRRGRLVTELGRLTNPEDDTYCIFIYHPYGVIFSKVLYKCILYLSNPNV